MTDAELIARLRDLGDHAAFEPHMHHVAANRIYGLGLLRDMAEARANRFEAALLEIATDEHPLGWIAIDALMATAVDDSQTANSAVKSNADRIAALDEIARLGQEFDAETEAGGSIIQGLREAAEYTKGMLKEGGK